MSENIMVSPNGRRASLRLQQQNTEEGSVDLDLTGDMQQEEKAQDQQQTGIKKNQDKEERELERFQLAEMVRDNYALLVGEDREQKEKAWQNIFDECKKGLNHTWTQGKDCAYLRKSYWPNMKCKALANHGKANASELQEFVYSFIQTPLENEDGEESPEKKKAASATRNSKKTAEMETNKNATPVNKTISASELVGTGRGPSRHSKRISNPQQLSDEQLTQLASPLNFTPPPGSRQSSQLSSVNTGGTEKPTRQNGGTKRRASQELTDLNTNSSTTTNGEDEGMAMDTTAGSTSELSDLEKELLQAKMQLCEAKARVNEAEANIHRLEKAIWEEMLKKGKITKMSQ